MHMCTMLVLGILVGVIVSFLLMWGFNKSPLPVVIPPAGSAADAVEKLVNAKAEELQSSGEVLHNLPCPLPQTIQSMLMTPSGTPYLFMYSMMGDMPGQLLFHGGDSMWCDQGSPNCSIESSSKLCSDMYDYQTLNGQRAVQDWIKIVSERDSGWVAYYWKESGGTVIKPKYTYLKRVPHSGVFLASGFSP